ncbi:protein bric-a-brac 1 isoform X2 [Anthonomus grandis grandis]|uniref:protein bric-a-brac 1 isoform X2 n=1 Tax=Anthonomus grandis grandis TaxID=2921223 RepID=UPI0021659AC6|nr:protein bric-a-brac 1 isoform X2 [Anthonomus grandis grandis]
MDSQQYCLRWNNHLKNLTDVLTDFLREQVLCDVTLASNGQVFQAHQIVLSACSPYFETLFIQTPHKHPIVFLKDVSPNEVKALLDFMYKGEVNVSQNLLPAFLKTAESLQIRGLSDSNNLNSQTDDREMENRPPQVRREREVQRQGRDSPSLKRKRTASNNNCDNTSNSVDRNASDSQVFVSDSPVDRDRADRGRPERDSGGTPSIKAEPNDLNPVESYHSMSEALQTTSFLSPSTSWGKYPAPSFQDEGLSLTPLVTASPYRHSTLRQYLDAPSIEDGYYDLASVPPHTSSGEVSNLQSLPSLYPRMPLPVPLELSGKSTAASSQECSVIQSSSAQKSNTPSNTQATLPKQLGRKGSRFRPSWLDSKWSGDMPDIRTSFAEGSSNFRLEIVNHHDKCKAHRLCVAREYHSEKSDPRGKSPLGESSFNMDGGGATSAEYGVYVQEEGGGK